MSPLHIIRAALPVLLLGAFAGEGFAAPRDTTTITILFQGDGEGFVDRGRDRLCGSARRSATCVITVPLGETVQLIARPAGGSAFILWQGCENRRYDGTANCLVRSTGGAVKVQAFLSLHNEPAAISSLRTLVSSRAMYYQGDVESDDNYDYATEGADADKTKMIDGVLGTGESSGGYIFRGDDPSDPNARPTKPKPK